MCVGRKWRNLRRSTNQTRKMTDFFLFPWVHVDEIRAPFFLLWIIASFVGLWSSLEKTNLYSKWVVCVCVTFRKSNRMSISFSAQSTWCTYQPPTLSLSPQIKKATRWSVWLESCWKWDSQQERKRASHEPWCGLMRMRFSSSVVIRSFGCKLPYLLRQC